MGQQTCTSDQALNFIECNTTWITPIERTNRDVSKVPITFLFPKSQSNWDNNATRRQGRLIATSRSLSCCDSVINTAQADISPGPGRDYRKPKIMIPKLAVNLLFTLMQTLLRPDNNLTHTLTRKKAGSFEVNVGPIDLLPTTRRHICQHQTKPCLADDRREIPVINTMCKTVRYPQQYKWAIPYESHIGSPLHEDPFTSSCKNDLSANARNPVISIHHNCALAK